MAKRGRGIKSLMFEGPQSTVVRMVASAMNSAAEAGVIAPDEDAEDIIVAPEKGSPFVYVHGRLTPDRARFLAGYVVGHSHGKLTYHEQLALPPPALAVALHDRADSGR